MLQGLRARGAAGVCAGSSVAFLTSRLTTSTSSASATPRAPCCCSHSGSAALAMHPTRLLRRPQTIKPNPNESRSGQFDKSFEKLTSTIESRLPFRQHHLSKGNLHEHLYGERSDEEMRAEAEEDLQGREKEKPAARQARSYFTDADLSPEAMHVRSPQLKVAQNQERLNYDKKILKTTAEAAEYYYPVLTLEQKRVYRMKLLAGWGAVAAATYVGLCKLGHHMRYDG